MRRVDRVPLPEGDDIEELLAVLRDLLADDMQFRERMQMGVRAAAGRDRSKAQGGRRSAGYEYVKLAGTRMVRRITQEREAPEGAGRHRGR